MVYLPRVHLGLDYSWKLGYSASTRKLNSLYGSASDKPGWYDNLSIRKMETVVCNCFCITGLWGPCNLAM